MAYTVVQGDTLNKIAAANNTTLSELLELNPQFRSNPDLIRPGQTVNLPEDSGAETGGGGGGGSTATPTGPGDLSDFGEGESYTGEEGTRFYELPGRPEIWQKDDGSYLVVYLVPGAEPEIPMVWTADEDDVQMMFGDGEAIKVDAVVTDEQLVNAGALSFGQASEVELRGENPFSGWASQFERQKEVLPWLEDPEVAALFASSWLEGREPSEAELASTDWFQSKTAGEQQWLTTLYGQPETAKQIQQDAEIATKNQMIQAGILDPPDHIVAYIAEQVYTGKQTEAWASEQISVLADPAYDAEMDAGVKAALDGATIDTTMEGERFVEETARTWLGSAFGALNEQQVKKWAGIIRNDPDGEDRFVDYLRSQRLALFPEYENPDLTYEDIAQPWRNFAMNSWGQNLGDEDDVLQHLIRTNDSAEASTYLRGEGLKRGVKKVEDDFVGQLAAQARSGAGVRRRL